MNAINPLSDLSQALETEVAAARGLAVAVRNASHRHISALLWQPDVVVTSEQAVGNRAFHLAGLCRCDRTCLCH